jgi:L-fuconolactonase
MNIDAHQHFWIYDPAEYGWIDDSMPALRHDFLPHDLQPELERNNFQGCVAVQARQTLEETRWLLRLAEQNPFILGVVGWVDLRSPQLRHDLAALAKNPKLVGVRHVVQGESDDRFLLQPDFLRGIAALEEFDLAYDILIYPKHLPVATEFVSRFPRHRFVLDHLAKPFIKQASLQPWVTQIKHLASFPNVFCKLSGLVTEADWQHWTPEHLTPYLDSAFDCFGVERLMIGSDWPVCTLAANYMRTMDVVKNYMEDFAENDRAAVMGGNAAKFWKLNLPA